MKRIIAVILIAVFCCGCAQNSATEVNTSMLNLRVKITYSDSIYEGILKTDESGQCELSFLYPEQLKGFSVSTEGANIKIKYMELEHLIPQSDLSEAMFIREICDCLKEIPNDTALQLKNEKIIYNGNCNGRAFTLEFDSQGIPKHLSVRSLDLADEFFEY